MKVVAILEDEVDAGGGFNQGLNAVLQMQRVCEGHFEFEAMACTRSGLAQLRALGVAATEFRLTWRDQLFLRLCAYGWTRRRLRAMRVVSSFEKRLLARGCDLAYFVRHSELPSMLQRLNFATTLFDLCHRDAPEFPEVREFGEFQIREEHVRAYTAGAVFIVVDSPAMAAAAARRYGLDPDRLLAMPYAPTALLDAAGSSSEAAVLSKYGLEKGYLFYPAQFWAHKNHVRILEALAILGKQSVRPNVVFSGGDKGNLGHVTRTADALGVRGQVRFLGFVPPQDLRGLYEGCVALVMPTYFGPTNLPPLEAWKVGGPVVYSSRCAEQAGDAALCVDPDDADALARAIQEAMEPETAAHLVRRGAWRLQQIEKERAAAEVELLRHLRAFDAKRSCWT